jgi:hypothetical protein
MIPVPAKCKGLLPWCTCWTFSNCHPFHFADIHCGTVSLLTSTIPHCQCPVQHKTSCCSRLPHTFVTK